MNRPELQQLSRERIEDARALLAVQRWSGAYYLAGYALECSLKSCVLAYIERTGIIFEDKTFARNCWTHDIDDLVKHAGLTAELGVAVSANADLSQNWSIARDWSESSRYRISTQQQAEKLIDALTDHPDGILPWVMKYW